MKGKGDAPSRDFLVPRPTLRSGIICGRGLPFYTINLEGNAPPRKGNAPSRDSLGASPHTPFRNYRR